jgi:DNA-binding beta-propeller fold protein YncE
MRRLAAFLICALAVAGCSSRDRLNPFDPANPKTGGRPADFRALADDEFVQLVWTPANTPGLRGFQILRRAPGQTAFQELTGVISPANGAFTDQQVANGLLYEYQLYFVFDDGPGATPATDRATPGMLRPWVAEFGGGSVARLTADTRHITARSGGFDTANDIAHDRNTGILWISDTFGGKVQVLDPAQGTFVNIPGLGEPGDIAIDLSDQTGWVCDPGSGSVRHYNRFGTSATPASIQLLDSPIGVAFEQSNRILWVCERGGNRVRTFLSNGAPQWQVPLPNPSRVAIDSTTREGWVTSFTTGKIYRLSPAGALLDSMTALSGPIGVGIDPRRGRIWVCDALGGRLFALDRGANVLFSLGGLPEVREVALDLRTGEAWATVPGDGRVVRVNGTGQIVEQVLGLADPTSITIDPGR